MEGGGREGGWGDGGCFVDVGNIFEKVGGDKWGRKRNFFPQGRREGGRE
jgi:hypothetical protein